jgi:hypothetical protein
MKSLLFLLISVAATSIEGQMGVKEEASTLVTLQKYATLILCDKANKRSKKEFVETLK